MTESARTAIDDYERSLGPEFRRANGVHYTPPALASLLVERAIWAFGDVPSTICDPACGSGAFLVAAADALAARGVGIAEIVRERLVGGELDPGAAAVARGALCLWAGDRGVAVDASDVRVEVGDSLFRRPDAWVGRGTDGFDLVVGNPPFLNQLSRRSARDDDARDRIVEQFGRVAGYADTAALFLLRSLELVRPGGVVALIQPQSFLAARDTAGIRTDALARAALVAVWASDELLFDAGVRVCAPVLRRHQAGVVLATGDPGGDDLDGGAPGTATPVQVLWGVPSQQFAAVPAPRADRSWGPLLAEPLGIPVVPPHVGATLAEVATATAGFRDEFYAITAALIEPPAESVASGDLTDWAERLDAGLRLVTVGMIDPGALSWQRTARRIDGARRLAPRVDLVRLAADSPRVASWVEQRRRPKVLVATQTRIVEAVADLDGDCVPVTPTISVEPLPGAPSLSHLTAALLAPPVSARALSEHLGAGLSSGALRWSARSVLEVGLPVDASAWDRGASLVERLATADDTTRRTVLAELAVVMTEAHHLAPDHPVVGWWMERAGLR